MKVFAIILSVAIASAVASPQGGLSDLGNIADGEGGVLNLGEIVSNVVNELLGINEGNFADNVDPNLSTDEVTNLGADLNAALKKLEDAINSGIVTPEGLEKAEDVTDEIQDILKELLPGMSDTIDDLDKVFESLIGNKVGTATLQQIVGPLGNIADLAQNFGN